MSPRTIDRPPRLTSIAVDLQDAHDCRHLRSSRRASVRQRQRQQQIERRAEGARHHPAADVRREDRRLLRQFDDRDDRDQRAVLEQGDEVIGHRRQRQPERLRPANQQQRLPGGESERPRRFELTGGTACERAAIDLALVRRVVERQPEQRRDEGRQFITDAASRNR